MALHGNRRLNIISIPSGRDRSLPVTGPGPARTTPGLFVCGTGTSGRTRPGMPCSASASADINAALSPMMIGDKAAGQSAVHRVWALRRVIVRGPPGDVAKRYRCRAVGRVNHGRGVLAAHGRCCSTPWWLAARPSHKTHASVRDLAGADGPSECVL
jgi:hypothetical protein